MNGTSVSHVAIRVNDLDSSLRHWEEALGFTVLERKSVPEEGIETVMLGPLGWSGGPDARVELIAPMAGDEDGAVRRRLASAGEGLHLLALRVDDLDATVSRLEASGCTIIARPTDDSERALVHPRSANGVLIELLPRPSS